MKTYTVIVQSRYPLCNNDGSPMYPSNQYVVNESKLIDEYISTNLLHVVGFTSDDPNFPYFEKAPEEEKTETTPKSNKSRVKTQEQENPNG